MKVILPSNIPFICESDDVMSYYLSRPPLLLPSGAIRFFHDGVSSSERSNQFRFDVEPLNVSDYDVILYVHQNLITEALTAVCQQWKP